MESESIMKPGHSWKQQTEVESYTISTCVFGEKLAHCVSLRQRQSCFDNLVMIHHWSKAEGRGAERVPHVALSLAVRQPSPEFSLSAPWIHQRNANLMSVVRQTQMFRPKYVHFICSGRGFHYQKKKKTNSMAKVDGSIPEFRVYSTCHHYGGFAIVQEVDSKTYRALVATRGCTWQKMLCSFGVWFLWEIFPHNKEM